jgi:hypothetical protein
MKLPGAEKEIAMTTMGKTLFVVLALGALFGATLALRTERTPPPPAAQLTAAQMAEVQPPKPADPPKASPSQAPVEDPAEPPELEPEDGSGS